jgi:hypothetical protein
MGASVDYVRQQGLLIGETFVNGVQVAIFGIARLFGFDTYSDAISVTSTTSRVILGHYDATYIVSGFTSELYLNFGLSGVAVGCLGLGAASGWLDNTFSRAKSVITRLLVAYGGSVIIFRVIPAEFGAAYLYVLYIGLPLILCAIAASLLRRGISGKLSHEQLGL